MRAHDEPAAKKDTTPARPPAPSTAGTPADRILALQRTAGNNAVARLVQQSTETVHSVLSEPGRPMDEPVRHEMEARLGADLSDVRLHTGSSAQRSAREIGARAYTSGNHVVIGPGGSDPHTLAHELTHVLQQRSGPVSGVDSGNGLRVSDPSDQFERAAEANARRVMSGPEPVQRAEHEPGHESEPEHEPGHEHEDPHQGATGTGEPVVQRRVGFEFEAQWNVRDVNNMAAAQAVYNQEVADRDRAIKVHLLRGIINAHRNNEQHRKLTEQDRQRSADELAQDWINGDAPTANGDLKLTSANLVPGQPEWKGAAMNLQWESRIQEEPLLGANLPKGRIPAGIIVAGTRFDLTADVSPTGGSTLEWVTDPLESTGEVKDVLKSITRMARYLNGRRNEPFIPSEDVTRGGGRPRPRLRIYPLERQELLFMPQVTGGLRIDSLVELLAFLAEPAPSAGSQAATQLFTEGRTSLTRSLNGARLAVAGNPQLATMDTAGLVSLLGLIGSYLRNAAVLPDGANPKSIAGGMLARTDFVHNFSLLPHPVKLHLQNSPAVFVSLAVASAGMNQQTGPDERVYPRTIERGPAGQRMNTTLPLTRRQWLEGMLNGSDYLKNWDLLRPDETLYAPAGPGVANEADWRVVHPSLGALVTVTDQVPTPDRSQVAALVVELRQMRGKRTVDDLEPLALSTFKLIDRLNKGKELRFS